jgi:hypothetical protein
VTTKTPLTDKLFDQVSDREAPDYSMTGHMPSKWSYEAILDLTDFARDLERQLIAAQKSLAEFEQVAWMGTRLNSAGELNHRTLNFSRDLLLNNDSYLGAEIEPLYARKKGASDE